jgi:hypothetical protein
LATGAGEIQKRVEYSFEIKKDIPGYNSRRDFHTVAALRGTDIRGRFNQRG